MFNSVESKSKLFPCQKALLESKMVDRLDNIRGDIPIREYVCYCKILEMKSIFKTYSFDICEEMLGLEVIKNMCSSCRYNV